MAIARHEGFLLVDKPAGLSSHNAVAMVRRARGGVRAGHTGTLDPFATGLLLVALGRSTRVIRFVPSEPKVYEATIVFGEGTDTDDATGKVVDHGCVPDETSIRRAVATLTGPLDQLPPAFSAKQVGGRRAYALARRGEEPVLRPARVVVERWDIHTVSNGRLYTTITCGAGTYIRALARDLGRDCGTVAHLGALRRTRIGPFDVCNAVAPDASSEVEPLGAALALAGMNRQVVTPDDASRLGHGQAIHARKASDTLPPPAVGGDTSPSAGSAAFTALVDESGDLIAIAERVGSSYHPRVVMHAGIAQWSHTGVRHL